MGLPLAVALGGTLQCGLVGAAHGPGHVGLRPAAGAQAQGQGAALRIGIAGCAADQALHLGLMGAADGEGFAIDEAGEHPGVDPREPGDGGGGDPVGAVDLHAVDAGAQFLGELAGVTEPQQKRKIIGNMFIEVFWDSVGDAEMLAQGTLYPDVIESASNAKSKASVIKTHHNRVAKILELQAEGKVLEPLAELFKDEVRELGTALGIPKDILMRHPFPGPGLSVRCPGVVDKERLDIIRECDAIFIGKLREHGWYDKVWQAYAGLIPVKTVGVKGDERSYEWATNLRAVISEDAMTADWVELPSIILRETSHKILNEVKGINRVLYDISTKPPASIEWE